MTELLGPKTMCELFDALAVPGNRVLGGGTDVIPQLKQGLTEATTLISLNHIPELRGIAHEERGLRIGATTSLLDIMRHPVVNATYPALAEALSQVGGPQHRSRGTLGGNICLTTRCSWYNQSEFWRDSLGYCLRLGGEYCQVAPKSSRCHAVFSSDGVPILIAYRAEVTLGSAQGTRRLLLRDLYQPDGMNHLVLHPGEVLLAVHLPKPAEGLVACYEKARVRGSFDFPLLGIACAAVRDGNQLQDLEFVLGAVESCPVCVGLADLNLSDLSLPLTDPKPITQALSRIARPMANAFYGPSWRKRIVAALGLKCLDRLRLIRRNEP